MESHWIVLSKHDECDIHFLKEYLLLGSKCITVGQEEERHNEAGRKVMREVLQ